MGDQRKKRLQWQMDSEEWLFWPMGSSKVYFIVRFWKIKGSFSLLGTAVSTSYRFLNSAKDAWKTVADEKSQFIVWPKTTSLWSEQCIGSKFWDSKIGQLSVKNTISLQTIIGPKNQREKVGNTQSGGGEKIRHKCVHPENSRFSMIWRVYPRNPSHAWFCAHTYIIWRKTTEFRGQIFLELTQNLFAWSEIMNGFVSGVRVEFF